MITLRKATSKDLPELLIFEQGVVTAERPFDAFLKEGDINYYNIQELVDSTEAELVVAEVANQIVGAGYAQIRQSKPYWKDQKFAYLGFMFVLPSFRGRGINQQIIGYLKAWAKSKDISEMRLDVYVENKAAIRAYEKTGFKNHMLEMRLNLLE